MRGGAGPWRSALRQPQLQEPNTVRITLVLLAALTACTACTRHGPSAPDPAAHRVHAAYVSAINSNDLPTLLGMLTEDVVFMGAHEPPYVGKAAVRPWLQEYLANYHTHWDKPTQEFVVSGDWAFERYAYKSTDTPLKGGDPVSDTGWGLVVYHHDSDGKWRVARDAWGPDHAAAH
jgi:ketosteroid isomerase-like protein